jgi:glutamyl-tRNA reductase
MAIIVTGINHKTAPVEIREALSFDEEQCISVNEQLIQHRLLKESVVLSTCNRTEIYGVVNDLSQLNGQIPKFLLNFVPESTAIPSSAFYHQNNEKTVEQLFQVACGLDSLVLGETQIFGQVKNAYSLASEHGATGLILNKLFHYAFHSGKRVRTETRIGEGAISVASVGVDLAKKIYSDLSEKKVLLVGAGEMAKQTVVHLNGQGVKKIYIINRTFKKAQSLSKEVAGKAILYDKLEEFLIKADIVIASTSAKQAILNKKTVSSIMEKRKNRPLLLIDISVPRNIDSNIKQVYNTYLYDIDDLQTIVKQNLGFRKNEISKARKIISEEVNEFMAWYRLLPAHDTIQKIQLHFEQIRKKEIHRNKKYVNEQDWNQMDIFSKSLMKKFLHSPIMRLKSCPETGNLCKRCTVKEVFGVEEE